MKQSVRKSIPPLYKRVFSLGTGLLLFLLTLWPAAAAEITLPRLEIASRGRVDDGEFVVSSLLSADVALTGGYKYAFTLGFSLEAADIAKAFSYRDFRVGTLSPGAPVTDVQYNMLGDKMNNQAYLGFRIAKATARDVLGLPLELSYFLGSGDDFCTGDEFGFRFGLFHVGTEFRGFFYFPEGIGGLATRQYNGIHGARGTGLSLALTKWDFITPIVYVYQNFSFPPGFINPGSTFGQENFYSGDLRLLLHQGRFGIEAFGGVSFNTSKDTSIRGGFMLHIAGTMVELFTQAGVPGWTTGEEFNVDNFFFLVEPRLHFGIFSLAATFFYHPVEYLHIITPDEKGKADINFKLQFGNVDSGLAGGIEAGGEQKTLDSGDFRLRVSPFMSFISGMLRWDAKIKIMPQDYQEAEKMIEVFIGVRTAF